jgi:hypothetical protein
MPQDKNSPPARKRNPNTPKDDLTAEFVRSILDYDPETGVLRWKVKRRHNALPGTEAGKLHQLGYRRIKIDRREYAAHRLAWLIAYGRWPDGQVDHINGIRDDNRLANLREATPSENMQNRNRSDAGSKTGALGVTVTSGKKYQAQIKIGGKSHYLGIYDTPEKASRVYKMFKRVLHPGWVEEEDIDTEK